MVGAPGRAGRGAVVAAVAAALAFVATTAGPVSAAPSPSGSRVVGGTSADAARLILPGQFVDEFDRGSDIGDTGTVRYYAADLSRGDTPYLSATIYPPAGRNDDSVELTITMTAPGHKDCSREDSESATPIGDVVAPLSAVLAVGEVAGPNWPSDCPTDGRFVFAVARSGLLAKDRALAGEIALRVEPQATTAGLPGAATGSPTFPDVPRGSGDGGSITAGAGPDDATVLRPGTWRAMPTTGTVGYYRVHLDWGQRLAVRVHVAAKDGLDASNGVPGELAVLSPLRQPLDDATRGGDLDGSANSLGSESADLAAATPIPVRYTNREGSASTQPYSVDGDFYLVLVLGHPFDDDTRDYSLPLTITLAVTGAAEPAPSYGARAGTAPTAPTAGGPDLLRWIGIGAAVGVVAVAAGLVLRRRQARRHT